MVPRQAFAAAPSKSRHLVAAMITRDIGFCEGPASVDLSGALAQSVRMVLQDAIRVSLALTWG
jgi:hypothetical protein